MNKRIIEIELFGLNGMVKRNLKQWSEELGINYGTLNSRYNRSGMRPPELFYPVKR